MLRAVPVTARFALKRGRSLGLGHSRPMQQGTPPTSRRPIAPALAPQAGAASEPTTAAWLLGRFDRTNAAKGRNDWPLRFGFDLSKHGKHVLPPVVQKACDHTSVAPLGLSA
jgi:hypothetical protein